MRASCRVAIALVALLVSSPLSPGAAETDAQVEARKVALDLAGAFSNEGFKLRDGHWSGPIKRGEQTLVAVNLYAGNQYWFSVGASPAAKKFSVRIYDENGRPLESDSFAEEERAAAGFSPNLSGQYFIGIAPEEGSANTTYCLVYSYK
ncbi:MAG TPA: hypothetical protein VG095_06710 [Chthoniobacterales bacterium]|nr:hypothetical protein [Chthoniobacterales bacterium]